MIFLSFMKQIRAQYTEDASSHQPESVDVDNFHVNGEASPCVYFIRGSCNRGSTCSFTHSFQAKKPQCKFFFSLQVIGLFEFVFFMMLSLL